MFSKSLFSIYCNWSAVGSKNNASLNFLALTCGKLNNVYNYNPVRYAARKGTRAAMLAEKRERKLKLAGKPEPVPKYLQRKVKVSAELERRRCTDENWLETSPVDNVWNLKFYRGKPYSVAEAITMHRETHQPAMLNAPSAFIYTSIELDLKTKKQDRFMDDFNGILIYPHEFEAAKTNKVIVVCKEADDQAKATEAGAVYTGSTSLIKQILKGTISNDEFDYLVCHPDMLKELGCLRGILKRKFPNTHNGLLRLDVDKAVISFMKGLEYETKRSTIEPDFGWINVCFGQLNMPLEHLEENLKYCLNAIEKHKPTGTENILFIVRTLLFCENSRERFKIPHWEFLPNYPKDGVLVEEENKILEEQEITQSA